MKKLLTLLLAALMVFAPVAQAEEMTLEEALNYIDELETLLDEAYEEIDALNAQLDGEEVPEDEEFDEEETEEAEEEAPAIELKDFADEDVIATVDGQEITYADVKPIYDYYATTYSAYFDMTDPEIIAMLRQEALYTVTQNIAVTRKGEEMGLYPFDDAAVQQYKDAAVAEYAEMVDYYQGYFATDDTTDEEARQATVEYLAENGYTEESAAEDAVMNALYDLIYNELTKDIVMTDEEAYAKYDEFAEEAKASYEEDPTVFDDDFMSGMQVYYIPAGYRSVKQILVMTDDESNEEEVQAKLDEIMARVHAGEDFDMLIAEYNDDPGMDEGSSYAETGYYVAETTTAFDTAFKDAAMALEKPGDVSEPAKGSYGYYIVRYDHDLQEGKIPLAADMLEEFKNNSLEEEKSNAYSDTLTQWVDALQVVPVEGYCE